jgi:ferredoxin
MSKKTDKMMVLEDTDFESLFDCLRSMKYRLLGPAVYNSAIVYDEIESAEELPRGYSDQQDGGKYRLLKNETSARFDYVVGQHSWKKYLFPPEKRLFEAKRNKEGFEISETNEPLTPMAFIGVRPCELSAIGVLDRIMMEGPYQDLFYTHGRKNLFMVVVNCTRPSGTCFCASMGTGPKAESGFDLALTEVVDGHQHYYLVEYGSPEGHEIFRKLPLKQASTEQMNRKHELLGSASQKMGRTLNTENLENILMLNFENPRWDMVAERCLSCGNCTLVCPTCFCINIKDTTSLDGQKAVQRREWDSCFTLDHSYISGGSIRISAMARYRQWMTHKLATWTQQYGVSGCVGCGRCITWCPVGIDITEEARAIRESHKDKTKD